MTDLAIRDEHDYLLVVREVRTLAERCDTVDGAKDLADRAAAMKVYAERANLGGEMVNRAAAAKLWAERRAGELLAELPKQTGGDAARTRSQPDTEVPPTLADLGVTKSQSSRYQALAAIPEPAFEQAVEQAQAQGTVSTAKVTRIAELGFEKKVKDEFFPSLPAFQAFWKSTDLLIKKAKPDVAAREEWDSKTRALVRQWVPLAIERLQQLDAIAAEPKLHALN